MAIILIGHTKGGTGKSTICVQSALTTIVRGINALMVDGDGQQTAMQMVSNRMEFGGHEPIPSAHYDDGHKLNAGVRGMLKQYEHIFIDAGGHDSQTLRAAILLADVVVTPVTVGIPELWALPDLVRVIAEISPARTKRRPLKLLALLNCCDARTDSPDNRLARAYVDDTPGFIRMRAEVVRRKSIARASVRGEAVRECRDADHLARTEIDNLVTEILESV